MTTLKKELRATLPAPAQSQQFSAHSASSDTCRALTEIDMSSVMVARLELGRVAASGATTHTDLNKPNNC